MTQGRSWAGHCLHMALASDPLRDHKPRTTTFESEAWRDNIIDVLEVPENPLTPAIFLWPRSQKDHLRSWISLVKGYRARPMASGIAQPQISTERMRIPHSAQ